MTLLPSPAIALLPLGYGATGQQLPLPQGPFVHPLCQPDSNVCAATLIPPQTRALLTQTMKCVVLLPFLLHNPLSWSSRAVTIHDDVDPKPYFDTEKKMQSVCVPRTRTDFALCASLRPAYLTCACARTATARPAHRRFASYRRGPFVRKLMTAPADTSRDAIEGAACCFAAHGVLAVS